eukprot:304644_1
MLAKIGYAVKHASHKNDLDDVQGRRSSDSGLLTYLTRQPQLDISGVKTTEEFVKTPNEEGTMFTRLYEPEDATKVKGMVFHCVGFCDTIDWTPTDIGVHFAKQGFVVFMVDNKGMGRSNGSFGYLTHWEKDIVEPALRLFSYAIDKYIKSNETYNKIIHEPQNYFVTGHSMGGANAICITLKLQQEPRAFSIKGTVVIAPMTGIHPDKIPPAAAQFILRRMVAPIWPCAKLVPGDLEVQTRDPELHRLINDNPLAFPHKHISVKTATVLLSAMEFIESNMSQFKTPLLLCQGDDDTLNECGTAKRFYEECGTAQGDKEIRIYKAKGHVLWKEEPVMLDDAIEWINKRLTNDQ